MYGVVFETLFVGSVGCYLSNDHNKMPLSTVLIHVLTAMRVSLVVYCISQACEPIGKWLHRWHHLYEQVCLAKAGIKM
jgi:hypothetical protein